MTDQELRELEAALEWADKSVKYWGGGPVDTNTKSLKTLAAAVRSLRETVDRADGIIARQTVKLSLCKTEIAELKQKLSAGRDGWIEKGKEWPS